MVITKKQLINAALEEIGMYAYDEDSSGGSSYTKRQVVAAALEKLGMESFNRSSSPLYSYSNKNIIDAALEEIGLDPVDFNVNGAEYQKCLRRLDVMMAEWLHNGYDMGYTFATDSSNPDLDAASDLSNFAHQAVYLNLAVKIAPSFGKQIFTDTKESAQQAYFVASNRSVSVAYQEKCLENMNVIAAKWLRDGIDIGYNIATNSDASVLDESSNIYDWALEAMYLALAVKIAPIFNKEPSPNVYNEAQAAYNVIKSKAVSQNNINKCARRLEAMMAEWSQKNLSLSYIMSQDTANINLVNDSGLPDWAVAAVYLNLAVRIAPIFNINVTPDTKKSAITALDAARRGTYFKNEMQYPNTLPIGSGNKSIGRLQKRFFEEKNVLKGVVISE